MLHRSLQRLAALLVLSIIVAGCGNDGGANVVEPVVVATQQIIVTPSLGRTRGAGVRAVQPDGTTLSDEVDTGGEGRAILQIPASYGGPLIIEMRGKAGATYFDEGSGQEEDFPEGQLLRSAMASPAGEVGLSILTELAVRLAEASGETLDADAINAANERIRAALAPEVADLLTPPTVVDGDTAAGSIDDSDAGQLAARLGALAMLATSDTAPALAILRQLADDVSDGVIDGVGADGMIADPVYMPATFASDFVTAVRDFAAAFGDETLQTSAADATADTSLEADDGDGTDGGDRGTGGGGTAAGACGSNAGPITEAGVDLDFVTNCAGTYTVTETTTGTHTSKSVTIGTDGAITFDTGVAFTADDVVAIFDRISVDRRIQINYGADDDADVIQLFLNEALDAVARIVYRNRTNSIEVDVNVSDDPDAVAEGSGTDAGDGTDTGGGSGGGETSELDPDGDGINGTTSAGTVASGVVGTFTLVYSDLSQDNDSDPFMDGEEVPVLIGADGTLRLGTSITLSNPFNRSLSLDGSPHLPEIIWYDSATDLEYALSDNERGTFNEINVGDASLPLGQFGLPTFLGQLRVPESMADNGSTTLALFAGFQDAIVVQGCTGRPNCQDETAIGDTVNVGIDSQGRVSFGSIVLDPATSGSQFNDNRVGTTQPNIDLRVPATGGDLFVRIYVDESVQPPQGQPVVGMMLQLFPESGGTSSIYVEQRELRSSHTDYFFNFTSRTDPPLKMVVVTDDTTYNGKADFLTTAPFGVSSLCRSFEITGVSNPTELPGASGDRPQFAWVTPDTRIESYLQRSTRLSTNAQSEQVMTADGVQFVLSGSNVRMEEGFVTAQSTSAFTIATLRDVSTSEQTAIDTACADFVSLGGMVSYTQAGTVTLEINDTSTDPATKIYERDFTFTESGSVAWEELLPGDLNYEITATAFGASSPTCSVPNGTGTLTATVSNADVSCTPSP